MLWQKKKHEQTAGDAAMRMSVLLAESALSDSWRYYHVHQENIKVDIADFAIDETVFYMHLLDRLAFALLRDRQFFLSVLAAGVAPYLVKARLLNEGDGIDELVRLCNEKTAMWGSLKLISHRGDPMDDWLFAVAARDITGASNPVFLVGFVERLVERFEVLKVALEGFAK